MQGFSSVDVAVIWPKAYVQFHICYKPTAELAHFASLGIPTVVYPFASYLDVLVDFGYPLIAENLADVSTRSTATSCQKQQDRLNPACGI